MAETVSLMSRRHDYGLYRMQIFNCRGKLNDLTMILNFFQFARKPQRCGMADAAARTLSLQALSPSEPSCGNSSLNASSFQPPTDSRINSRSSIALIVGKPSTIFACTSALST